MPPHAPEEQRVVLWAAFAEHFLDTDSRWRIPHAAHVCVRSSTSEAEARDIWRYEVTPALWRNLLGMGEWACWDDGWLRARIHRVQGSMLNRPGTLGRLVYRMRSWDGDRYWVAIARCIALLSGKDGPAQDKLVSQLEILARIFFDVAPPPAEVLLNASDLWGVYRTTFLPIFEPLVIRSRTADESIANCRARVEAALGKR